MQKLITSLYSQTEMDLGGERNKQQLPAQAAGGAIQRREHGGPQTFIEDLLCDIIQVGV